jgi:hypothetical protein
MYNGATVLSSAASHAEIKVHYRLDVTKKGLMNFSPGRLPNLPKTKFT